MTQSSIYDTRAISKNKVMTFRMSDNTFKLLESLSARRNIKVGALINQIIDTHLNFYMLAIEDNMMPLSKETISVLLESISDEIDTKCHCIWQGY